MIIVPPGIEKGIRKGFEVSYNNATSIKIGAGSFESNGKLYALSWPEINYSSSDVEVLSGNRYELPSGHGLTFQIGQFIDVAGFTTGANNGVKEVTGFSGDQVTVAESLTIEAAGDPVTIDSYPFVHAMTGLASGYDQHYIYIDDDASTPPTPTIIDSTTEPSWSQAKNGWYNGDDAMIFGAVPSKPAAAEIEYFFTYYLSGRYYRAVIGSDNWMILNGISLTGNWQDPTTAASVYLPVNAKEALIKMYNTDGLANVKLSWLHNEAAALNSNIFHSKTRINIYNEALFSAWGGLGASRNIKIGGDSANDNVTQVFVGGWGGKR